jgi:hypothetical protein
MWYKEYICKGERSSGRYCWKLGQKRFKILVKKGSEYTVEERPTLRYSDLDDIENVLMEKIAIQALIYFPRNSKWDKEVLVLESAIESFERSIKLSETGAKSNEKGEMFEIFCRLHHIRIKLLLCIMLK